jgi:regulator of protease activity HflC (stomatin/prohibitin superfamily)
MAHVTVQDGQAAVVRRDGAVAGVLGVGRHRLPGWFWRRSVELVDVRERLLVLSGQELAAADVPGVKVSATAGWRIVDPVRWLDAAAEPFENLRLAVALAVRDWVAARTLTDLVADRGGAAEPLTVQVRDAVGRLGIEVTAVSIRDIVVPGEVRRAVLAVATARQEGLAALERARGETAALRAMANGAKLLADHPELAQLRMVQAAAAHGGSLVLQIGERSTGR